MIILWKSIPNETCTLVNRLLLESVSVDMLKFLAILFIVSYLTYKVGGFLMRALYVTLGQDPTKRNFQSRSRKSPDGNINIDYVPKDKKSPKKDFKGGDYVDYEEVK